MTTKYGTDAVETARYLIREKGMTVEDAIRDMRASCHTWKLPQEIEDMIRREN